MTVSLLSENQQRRLGTHLRLLLDDLAALADAPALRGHPHLHRLVDDAMQAAAALRAELDLPEERGPSLRRRMAATAEVWAVRVEDLRAQRLRAYGPVDPNLAAVLDPRLEAMRKILLALADAASELPEHDP
ncbi:MAG TPA: hypothetical protein VMH88_05440 [Gemmatimonadales bacterium]|nr:hypothetical protein [Gemmatimonadales bacterium]